MNKNAYWRKREEEQLKHYISEETELQRIMAERYSYMLRQIQVQINDFYARYARREQITLAEAIQRVSKMDVQAFGAKAKKYVEEKDFTPKANQELRLYNATMRINRLELLKANIGLEMLDGFNDLEKTLDQGLTKRTEDELKRQEDILRREAGILNTTVFDNAKTVQTIVNASFNNATWSERIWGNQTQLKNELSSLLTQGLIQGKNPITLAPAIERLFGVSRRAAERLMVTEMARVQTDAQMESYKRNDIDQYVFISVDTACKECMALNGNHYPVKDMMPGENAPPIHPNCRCSTAAYIDRAAVEREVFGEPEQLRQINRMKASDGHEIIDDRTYKKLTNEFVRDGGLIIRGKDAERHLGDGASASYLPGAKIAFIRDDATVSDVAEEMRHAYQDRTHMYGSKLTNELLLRREIEAQKYLIRRRKRYKIPLEETEVTKRNLADYERRLKHLLSKGG